MCVYCFSNLEMLAVRATRRSINRKAFTIMGFAPMLATH
ncbi:hypothetical protein PAMC26510_36685 [Caballeronia sordidicola]|uniref:Uncharacterized protein n=1 Tax=Caballeronia sordidicola TaxID=196367 RepID=A0A242M3L0_CABSO|nr:hypothetical protein PAMC26510_36685 [Caballeronia sordidicola]